VSRCVSSVQRFCSHSMLWFRQVAIIHVEERDFVLEPITLKTVRPFVMDDIDLDDAIEAAQVKIDEKQGVAKVLKKKIHELIARAEREWQEKNKDIPVKDRPEKMLPLVRLRVAHTRHDIGNIVRFGQDFVDKVANPRDLLQFHKKKATQASKKNSNIKENYLEPTDEMLPAERLEKVHMSDLVQTYLASQQLQILNPAGLERAVMNFVDKDDREAIGHFVEKEMKTTNLGLVAMAPDEKKLQEELNRIREEKMRLEEGEDEDEEVDQSGRREESTAKTAKATNGNSATSKRMLVDSDDSMLSDMEDDGFQENRRRPAPTAAKNGRSTAAASQSQRTPKMTQSTLMFRGNSDDEEDDDVSPPLRATASTSSRAAALSESTTKKKPPAKKATATTTKARGAAAGGRAAAKKASSRFVESQAGEDDDDDEDNYSIVISDDDGFEAPTKSKAKAKPATSRARR
jgi:double-strand break repair protein MRE11